MAYTVTIEKLIITGDLGEAVRATVRIDEDGKEIYRENILLPEGTTDAAAIEAIVTNWAKPISSKHANRKKLDVDKTLIEGKTTPL